MTRASSIALFLAAPAFAGLLLLLLRPARS